jgi:hypothetical protein
MSTNDIAQSDIEEYEWSKGVEDIEESIEEKAPLEPLESLFYYITKYKIVEEDNRTGGYQGARDLLLKGTEVSIPYLINVGGEAIPYRIYPIAAYRVINAAVKSLEKDLEYRLNKKSKESLLSPQMISGIATLADSLFSGGFTHPEGNFLIHRPDPKTGEIVLNGHGRRMKQLSARLQKCKATFDNLKEISGEVSFPTLACEQVVKEEIASSYQRWKITRGADFQGNSPLESSESIESLKENLGYEPSIYGSTDNYDLKAIGGIDEDSIEVESEISQANWIGVDLGFNLNYRATVRGNIMTSSPKEWLWTHEEAPLDYITNYVVDSATPCLEEAHSLLIQASEDPEKKIVGNFALTLDCKNKLNPDSYWKIIRRISSHFPSTRPETDVTTKRLDTARFVLSLKAINQKFEVNQEAFNKAFQVNVYKTIDAGQSDQVTRNSLLLETLKEVEPDWDKIKREQWLESLQTYAVGAYENSLAMEKDRKKLLNRLNHLFKVPREELEKAKNNPERKSEAIEKLNEVLVSASNAFYEYLSGKTGQMTRRELRTKIQEMKAYAEKTGNRELLETLGSISKFVSSISSQIKSGDWYKKEAENKATIFEFLVTMLETPKAKNKPEFIGSKEPASKDPLSITIDFLAAYGNEKEVPPGKNTIKEVLDLWKERQSQDAGGKLAEALKEITKNKSETLAVIKEREKALTGAINLSKKIKDSEDPIKTMISQFEEELDILSLSDPKNAGSLPDPFQSPESPVFVDGSKLGSELPKALDWLNKKASELEAKAKGDKLNLNDTKNALEARNAATLLLGEKIDSQEEKTKCLENVIKLKNLVSNRLDQTLEFWKGVNYIAQNIQSRREEDKYQITPSGKGTLQNIIAITKSRISEKDAKVLKNNETLGSLRQFQISKTRRRSLNFNVAIPLSLWLSAQEKGTKTKITKEDFISTLEARQKSCRVCLDIESMDNKLEEKLHEYRERERDDKYVVNTHILDQCIRMLEDKENFKQGIQIINEHPKAVRLLQEQGQDTDTPNKISLAFVENNNIEIKNKEKEKRETTIEQEFGLV